MDVQGSEFHLLHGPMDWGACLDTVHDLPLRDVGAIGPSPELSLPDSAWEYDARRDWLRLRRDTARFQPALRTLPMTAEARRGAGRDRYGAWYWIGPDRRTIHHREVGAAASAPWWTIDELHAHCGCRAPAGARFGSVVTCPVDPAVLVGLAVTTTHHLVVGYDGPAGAGLFAFDLHAGGGPERITFGAAPFAPWDLADTAEGGVLVLDRDHGTYWHLDRNLRVAGEENTRPGTFADLDAEGTVTTRAYRTQPSTPGWALRGGDGTPLRPVSIEPGPPGTVLVLESDADPGYSTVHCFARETLVWSRPLRDIIEVIDSDDPTHTPRRISLLAHDFAYLPAGSARPLENPLLYLADAQGDQVVAFTLDPGTGAVVAQDDFLPLRRWAGRALVRAAGSLWYDFGERWIEVGVFTECRFAGTATLVTPPPVGDLPGEPFDSRLPACVWHRLLLDALVPSGTSILVEARAADEVDVLPAQPWVTQPAPLRRGGGSELPWADPWRDQRDPRDPAAPLPDGLGTLELLFQDVVGRYLQLRVTLSGCGRASAAIRSLRAWFPRFSYVQHYLPAVYAEHDLGARFLERMLANPEGVLTVLEEKIEHTHLLLDARTARDVDLDWLGRWFALLLDPAWPVDRRRFLIEHVDAFHRRRGTPAGLVGMLRVLFDPAVSERGVFRLHGVPATRSRIRLVERFLTRGPGLDRVRQNAHRFVLQVPRCLEQDKVELARRIVEQGKPAHAEYTLEVYDSTFMVDAARLGLDTELGDSWRFTPIVLDLTLVAAGHLSATWPFDVTDRMVTGRDRLPDGPPL
ncbi:phage tail-like protein [Kineosphaera limosa]|uniref:Phage tail protein n=1 Tax=Kineosphaera limosa NBRC 100340 TaxID=1184609 RepID=K6WNH7_9MICO|nr:phage tail protein [Kineosphaera limosa]NYE02048.1 phage tail-like protein [Kineosphaera limosa]GAB95346.1 hypothetical protein KILIM_018_00960 [Kineosphaera limosa NBRC 100340]